MTTSAPDRTGPTVQLLDDGKRLHLQHGPIDLIIQAYGKPDHIVKAYKNASYRFQTILQELVDELALLRSRYNDRSPKPSGIVAREMFTAVGNYSSQFITPMAAVAGAVADEILKVMVEQNQLTKAYVNNGGDIAIYLNPASSQNFKIGIVANPVSGQIITHAKISNKDNIAGIATSGWHGRSHSLGIADAVTVFAKTAAMADVAATIIANHTNLPNHSKIQRQAASEISPDSDLGELPITIAVGHLTNSETKQALKSGADKAQQMLQQGKISAAFLSLKGRHEIIGWPDEKINAIPVAETLKLKQERFAHA